MKLNCILDTIGYKHKPSKPEFGGLSNRIAAGKERSLTIEEFKKELEQGKAYLSGHFIDRSKGRTKGNIKNINFFSLDVDNHYKEANQDIYTNYTRKEAIEKVKELLGITPFMAYTTYTGKNPNGSERFRLVYAIDLFCGSGELSLIADYILNNSDDLFDNACKDASRIFLSTNKNIDIYKDYKPLKVEVIEGLKAKEAAKQEKLKEEAERKREAKKVRKESGGYLENYSDDIIDELKNIDISDYLISEGYSDIKKYKEGYKMPCPIHHGKDDNFHINYKDGSWLYNCFSQCGGKGGTIIDLHMALNNLDVGQAINELCNKYNIKPLKRTVKDLTTYTIDKYIGQDKEATRGILKALSNNKKILITGAMGCGKTHFVSNDIYEYAKEINKVLVMVIPGQKQLENLHTTKGIDVVYEKMPVYMGSDRVATTPESLPKVIKDIGPDNYILVVDESHERYTSLFRRGYQDKNIEAAEATAYKSIHMTATPRLLANDNFDEVISIETRSIISNNISIFKVKNKLDDNMLSMAKRLINNNMKPILFNNNKGINEIFADLVEVKESIKIAEYKEGQLDLIGGDKPEIKEVTKTIIGTETIKSGKRSDNIASGQVKEDFTATTSAVMAGIDLYTDDNAILLVNTRGLVFDNLIQLIGRFREGIPVVLIVEDPKYPKDYFDFEHRAAFKIKCSHDLAAIANNNKNIDFLLKDGLQEKAHIEYINGKWIVDEIAIIAEVYKQWSKGVFDNIGTLKQLLEGQKAFKVKSIVVAEYMDESETTISEIKKLSKEEKKAFIEKTSKELLSLDDDTLSKVINKDIEFMEDQEKYKKFYKVASKHIDRIYQTAEKLFTDEEGNQDLVTAFRYFYSKTWASIQREIEAVQAREVNRLIKSHGLDFYLSNEAARYKRSIDVVQAKIRHELKDLEEKRGRITQMRLYQLIKILVKEGYIYNKYTKILANDPDDKDKEKALKCLADIVGQKVGNIYNFRANTNIISSLKE